MFPHSHHHLCEMHITVANSQIGGYLLFISEVPIVGGGFRMVSNQSWTPLLIRRCKYRPYAIPHITKRETDTGQTSGYYAAILSSKEDGGLWSVSTLAKHFASSLRQ